jgi:hypothetical protein
MFRCLETPPADEVATAEPKWGRKDIQSEGSFQPAFFFGWIPA